MLLINSKKWALLYLKGKFLSEFDVWLFWILGFGEIGPWKGVEWEGKEEEGIAEKGGKREEAERGTRKDSLSFLQFICCLLMAHEMQICKTNQPGLEKKKILLSFHRFISLFSVGNPKLKSFAAKSDSTFHPFQNACYYSTTTLTIF